MRRIGIPRISLHDLLATAGPVVLLVIAGFWIAYQFVEPAPPRRVVISTGSPGGAYHAFAERYRGILARNDIRLEIRPSSGSIENLQRLKSDDSGVDIAFVQAGIAQEGEDSELVSLGNLYYEPVWVFYRDGQTLDRLSQLKGKRVAVGGEGSGTQLLALQLLIASGFETDEPGFVTLGGDAAESALEKGEVDAVFFIAAPEATTIQRLLRIPGVKLMNFAQADAYTKRLPFLSVVKLPEGGIDLVRNIPPHDTLLVAPTAHLVARYDLHPALASLLAQVLLEVHGKPGLFSRAGEFPTFRDNDFPHSDVAQRNFKSGPPFLQRYLPFWVAVFVDRLVVMLIPLFALLIPASKIVPALYAWRIRSRIYHGYGELKYLENDIRQHFDADKIGEYMEKLDRIEEKANVRPIPLSFTSELYALREHINLVRGALVRQQAKMRERSA
ncbi:MAG: C4-dicarboxylate ABC transporter substrate-binding protein [Rhodocyclaceae bacterium]|jgi:TRAP transporter TAXI family solute receptor|nr:C4-dicarboxylate ABC transporter substrate-binding protein [Rhodocyclaceae bacterium]